VSQAERLDAFRGFVGTPEDRSLGCTERLKPPERSIDFCVVELDTSPALIANPAIAFRAAAAHGGDRQCSNRRAHSRMASRRSPTRKRSTTPGSWRRGKGLGVNAAAAMKLLDGPSAGGTVVLLLCD